MQYANINTKNHRGKTLLMYAAKLGHNDIVEFLLKKGAETESYNHKGRTALFLAVKNKQSDVVKLLLKYGCDYTDNEDTIGYDLGYFGFKNDYGYLLN